MRSSAVIKPPRRRGLGFAPPNAPGETPAKGGLTALLFAVREGAFDSVKALVAAGANVNQPSIDGSSPLLVAVQNGFYDIAALPDRTRRRCEPGQRQRLDSALPGGQESRPGNDCDPRAEHRRRARIHPDSAGAQGRSECSDQGGYRDPSRHDRGVAQGSGCDAAAAGRDLRRSHRGQDAAGPRRRPADPDLRSHHAAHGRIGRRLGRRPAARILRGRRRSKSSSCCSNAGPM